MCKQFFRIPKKKKKKKKRDTLMKIVMTDLTLRKTLNRNDISFDGQKKQIKPKMAN